jgi:hypothetical protein
MASMSEIGRVDPAVASSISPPAPMTNFYWIE